MAVDYILYGGDHSYFTGKVRPYLRYKNLNWEEQTATREVYKTIILPKIGAPIIPVMETADGHYVQDTTEIIDFLEERHPESSIYPEGPAQRLAALLFELLGDEWLMIPAMHYRWSVLEDQHEFIMLEFGRLSIPDATREEQLAVGEKTCKPFRGSIGVLGINEATVPGIEEAYLAFLDQLNKHFTEHDFLLGSRPSIGDFGLMGPLYAHLGRDPVPLAIMRERAPKVYEWVQRMNNPVPLSGEFLADDAIPETLIPILQTQCRDQFSDVLSVIKHNAKWLKENPGSNIPRHLGMHRFHYGSAQGERMISSYAQWMFQRGWAHYQSLAPEARADVDKLLEKIGAYEAMNTPLAHWLVRKPGQLELVEGASDLTTAAK
jgi:glutathione S-transferase